ncbi:GH92 family glycosyl hydrolase [Carboxylicivirga sp. N1Y90]|uniref:GH92 family glycosyl hydrolase n=1 Tax=Carboxylicivirga fragile TaxID=3417571 RepID=UPI003D33304F|nr:GH92 family glycosyl hydrolase [Marinilabiliaceae bacterium N1Y90]
MQMKSLVILFFSIGLFQHIKAQEPVDYVNPFIGSDNYGTTNPGAIVPRGMISAVPFNVSGRPNKHEKDSDWWSTPYSSANETLTGFSHVNLSGVGCPDLGTIILMPTTGDLKISSGEYASTYSHEEASPGYYSNYLNRYDVKAEVTTSVRSAINRYTFPKGRANILLNLGLGLTNEQDGYLRIKSDNEVEGFRTVGSFCYNNPDEIYPVYFVIKVNKSADKYGAWKKPPLYHGAEANWMSYNGQTRLLNEYTKPLVGDSLGAFFSFDFKEPTQVEVLIGISYVSIENARENLEQEITNKCFDDLRAEARALWNDKLSRVKITGGTSDEKTMFYSALYHAQIHPNTLNDVNGEYPTIGSGNIGKTDGTRYTVFSLWDTYRNMHQLTSLLYPKEQLGMVNSMLDMYKENGWLPKWELNSTETFTMVGDPAAIVIADTYMRGITGFDTELALEAMLKSATQEKDNPLRPELSDYLSYSYIPVQEKYDGSVSTTLEYGAADFAIAQMAKSLGHKNIYTDFTKRSQYYKNMYDSELGVMRPRLDNGQWHTPFSPLDGANFESVTGFIEGTSWHYSFMIPYDVKGLIKLNGGKKSFVNKLQSVFDNGLYEPDNEPDMGYAFLFNYVKGEEWRTQKEVNKIIDHDYSNSPGGLPGNDDTGTMSAWLVFAMMGIYPDAPAIPHYTICSPRFDLVEIRLDEEIYSGETFRIEAIRTNTKAQEINKMELNGKALNNYFISHDDVINGGTLKIWLK